MRRVLSLLQGETRKEPGCVQFVVSQGRDDRSLFFIYEEYKDDAALEAHRGTRHFQQYARGELMKAGERVNGFLCDPI